VSSQIGDTIAFGEYDWHVLDVCGDKALIITKNIIDQRPYHNAYKDTTWADCALRKYLNDEFYNKFSEADKSRIILVVNKNLNNEWYGTNGGEDTEDNIFLLSIEEVTCRYFGDSSAKLYDTRKNKRYWFERKDINNDKRIARLENGRIWWWWLRSSGRVPLKAVYIHGDGNIGIQGNNILKGNIADGRCTGGVRPALWLILKQ